MFPFFSNFGIWGRQNFQESKKNFSGVKNHFADESKFELK
jgi:hypothetical protein